MTLAEEIEAGNGTDEAVALGLGWRLDAVPGKWEFWKAPYDKSANSGWFDVPPFLTGAEAAEREARSREWSLLVLGPFDMQMASGRAFAATVKTPNGEFYGQSNVRHWAACAALVRANQSATSADTDAA